MSGFATKQLELLQQALPTYATASIEYRGFTVFLDPLLTGRTRYCQRSGADRALLSPQIRSALSVPAMPTQTRVTLVSNRLQKWLRPSTVVTLEGQERLVVADSAENEDGTLTVLLNTPVVTAHAVGAYLEIYSFPVSIGVAALGQGAALTTPVEITTPWLLVPGDTLTVNGMILTLAEVLETGVAINGDLVYDVRVTQAAGFPALIGGGTGTMRAMPAYQSEVLTLPVSTSVSTTIPPVLGPFVLDWVSGPLVENYRPEPESRGFVRTLTVANTQLTPQTAMAKNSVQSRMTIPADIMLFWRVAEGGMNWDGSNFLLRAFASGRAHTWTPCAPPLDPAPKVTVTGNVLSVAPYNFVLKPGFLADDFLAYDVIAQVYIPSTDYSLDPTLGNANFLAGYAGKEIVVTYRPRLGWLVQVTPSEPNIELVVVFGNEPKQVFSLGAGGVPQTIALQTVTNQPVTSMHVTARRVDGSVGPMQVAFSDWHTTGSTVGAIQYWLSTGATRDYDWASSGLLIKPLWYNLELLRVRLDGTGALQKLLDSPGLRL